MDKKEIKKFNKMINNIYEWATYRNT
jgi:hypothetical protein